MNYVNFDYLPSSVLSSRPPRSKEITLKVEDKTESIENILNQTRSSERKFKEGNFKGAIDDKREVRFLLKSKNCDKNIFNKFKEELSCIYVSKFDLINDHKLRLDESEIKRF